MIEIKVFDKNQLDQINDALHIRKVVFEEEQHVEHDLEFDGMDHLYIHFVLYKDQKALATARVCEYKDDVYKVGRVATLKEYRRQGFGLKLMKEIINYCREKEANQVILGAQLSALEFYRQLGFEAYGDMYMDADIEHMNMKLDL